MVICGRKNHVRIATTSGIVSRGEGTARKGGKVQEFEKCCASAKNHRRIERAQGYMSWRVDEYLE